MKFDHEKDDIRLIKVRVTDSAGLTFDTEFEISIVDINEIPIIDPIEPQSVVTNKTLTFKAMTTDVEGAALSWSLGEGAPSGASIDPLTGAFSWDTTGFELDEYRFDICVSNGFYLVCETITVTVRPIPDPLPIKFYPPLIFR